MNEQKLQKKLTIMIVTVVLLMAGLIITSFALADSIVSIQNNRFSMSMGVALQVNGGQPFVNMNDIIFEPGATHCSEFPISNRGSFDVWYRIYFTDVVGELGDNIKVLVKDEDGNPLCDGLMCDLGMDKVAVGTLEAGDEKKIYIEFQFLSGTDNTAQGQTVSFNIVADATQKQNNPYMNFGD